MAPELGFEAEARESKKERIHTSKFFPHGQPSNPFVSNSTSTLPEPATKWFPQPNTSPLSSTISTISSTPTTWTNHKWKAPDSKVLESAQNRLQEALTETTKRAAIAERKTAEYLQAKDSAERQLGVCTAEKAALSASNKQLTAEIRRLKEEFHKLEKRTKGAEKAATKAQNEAKHAKGFADHCVNSQKGQLKSAERGFAEATRELKEWKERYACVVEKPAEEKAGPQTIAVLNGGLQGATDAEVSHGSDGSGEEKGRTGIKESQSKIKVEQDPSTEAAEAQAAKFKKERDTLHRMLQEEMAKNVKLAESLVLRNAKLGESLQSWATDVGES